MMEVMCCIFTHVRYEYLVIDNDNIIIYYIMHEKHVGYLKKVLQRQEEQMFYLKESKYEFFTGKLKIQSNI